MSARWRRARRPAIRCPWHHGILATNVSLYKKIGFDRPGLCAITLVGAQANVIYVNPPPAGAEAQRADCLRQGQSNKVSWASGGHGTAAHLAASF
jgi:hypothetical protein